MDDCCENKGSELANLRMSQAHVLKIVLVINLVMFFIEAAAGIAARSTALLSDSLDMLGDAIVYAFSLYVLHKSDRWRAGSALSKGALMMISGLVVLGEAQSKIWSSIIPEAPTMGIFGALALVANLTCLALLVRHRDDDVNLRSTWRCSRNDILSNLGVLAASAGVAAFHSKWPDILIGTLIATLFLLSSWTTFKEAYKAWTLAETSEPK